MPYFIHQLLYFIHIVLIDVSGTVYPLCNLVQTGTDSSKLCIIISQITVIDMFHVFDYDIEVKDELIGEALKSLPEKKRNVILLSFFLDMTDTEIAKYMNLVRSTIHYHRTSSLIALKKIMEEIRTGKKK